MSLKGLTQLSHFSTMMFGIALGMTLCLLYQHMVKIIITPGIFGFARFLYFYFAEGGEGHLQSLIFSTVLITIGFTVLMSGVIADLISNNRKLIENVS